MPPQAAIGKLEFTTASGRWRANLAVPIDLAIPLAFDGAQPRFFATEAARAAPMRTGGFSGDVRNGSSCNCGVYTLAPHCHGTHTECVGHLTAGGPEVAALTPVPPALALLVSVQPVALGGGVGTGPGTQAPSDLVITHAMLAAAAAPWQAADWAALVVRTLPNEASKRERVYDGPSPAPYFTAEAMQWVVERDVTSLVVDLPSLDRADDGGALAAHRAFWGLPLAAREAGLARRGHALVTELAFVPDTAPDGLYLLELHVPAFAADAAPSRPVLYPVAAA